MDSDRESMQTAHRITRRVRPWDTRDLTVIIYDLLSAFEELSSEVRILKEQNAKLEKTVNQLRKKLEKTTRGRGGKDEGGQ